MNKQDKLKAIIPISMLVISIGICSVGKISFAVAFLLSLIPLGVICIKNGEHFRTLLKESIQALKKLKSIFAIILLMGTSISMWLSSGTVVYLMKMCLGLAQGAFFLPMSFLLTALCSMVIGTALGTFSTIGMAFYGIGIRSGIDPSLMVGVLVSGVFLSDRLSPMSGLVNITLRMTGVKYKEYFIKSIIKLIAFVSFTAILYYVVGLNQTNKLSATGIEAIERIANGYSLSPLLWAMPLLMLVMAVLGMNTIQMLSSCTGLGFVLTCWYQQKPVVQVFEWLLYGFSTADGAIKGGGISGMIEVLIIVALAIVYNEWLKLSGITTILNDWLTKGVSSNKAMMRRMGLFSIGLTSLTCDQTVGILLPIEAMAKQEEPISQVDQAIVVSNTGTLIAPLESWNVNALIIFTLTGVSAWQYGIWAVFCWAVPLGEIIWPTQTRTKAV